MKDICYTVRVQRVVKVNSDNTDSHIDGTKGWLAGRSLKFLYKNKQIYLGIVFFDKSLTETFFPSTLPVLITSTRFKIIQHIGVNVPLNPVQSNYIKELIIKTKNLFKMNYGEEERNQIIIEKNFI